MHTQPATDRHGRKAVAFTCNFALQTFRVLGKATPETFMSRIKILYERAK